MKYANKVDLIANEYQCISYASIENKIERLEKKREFLEFASFFNFILILIELCILVFWCGAWALVSDQTFPILAIIMVIMLVASFVGAIWLSSRLEKLNDFFRDDFKFMGLHYLKILSYKHSLKSYFENEIVAERYDKIKAISEYSPLFYKKAQEVLKYRNGMITDFDYAAMDCEKLYAEVLRLQKKSEIQKEKDAAKRKIFNL